MKKLTLTLLASAALIVPAMAQQPSQSTPNSSLQAPMSSQPMSSQRQAPMSSGRQALISPRSLGRGQIRQIQQSLNRRGFAAGEVDGIWGPRTRIAFEKFQKSRQLAPLGELNRQALTDLGVKVAQAQPTRRSLKVGRSVSSRSRYTKTKKLHPSSMSHKARGMHTGRSVASPAPSAKQLNRRNPSLQNKTNGTNSSKPNGY